VRLRAIEANIAAGRFQQAASALNSLIAANPADPRPYLTAAMLAQATSNPEREIEALRHAVGAAPRWWPAHAELAKALARNDQPAAALVAANTAVELAPIDMGALEVAVAVANSAGSPATARRHLEAALILRPHDIAIRRALGAALERMQLYAEAVEQWQIILAELPDDVGALGWLGHCLLALGRKDEARKALERALELNPDHPSLAFHLALARGETPTSQPISLVQQLFDEYAGRFNVHLEGRLHYRLPRHVADIIRARHPALDISILDLGCGTGLLGAQIGPIKGAFVGVDLSRNMLEKAKQLGVYTRLRLNDLSAEMQEIAADSFDYVTACDVFIYVGDLTQAIAAAFRVLHPGGALIFSCELAQEAEGPLVLRSTKRFAHSRSSIEKICLDTGFRTCKIETLELRLDSAGVIDGFNVVAEK